MMTLTTVKRRSLKLNHLTVIGKKHPHSCSKCDSCGSHSLFQKHNWRSIVYCVSTWFLFHGETTSLILIEVVAVHLPLPPPFVLLSFSEELASQGEIPHFYQQQPRGVCYTCGQDGHFAHMYSRGRLLFHYHNDYPGAKCTEMVTVPQHFATSPTVIMSYQISVGHLRRTQVSVYNHRASTTQWHCENSVCRGGTVKEKKS